MSRGVDFVRPPWTYLPIARLLMSGFWFVAVWTYEMGEPEYSTLNSNRRLKGLAHHLLAAPATGSFVAFKVAAAGWAEASVLLWDAELALAWVWA